jgi:hypothetical protein
MSFNIIKCEPWGLPYTGALSTLRLYPITSGAAKGRTYIEWRGQYSNDATAGKLLPAEARDLILIHPSETIEDAKLKRREGLADLAKAFEKG